VLIALADLAEVRSLHELLWLRRNRGAAIMLPSGNLWSRW
jgi:hypothetical protein